LNDKLGITTDNVKTNNYADMGMPFREMMQREKEVLQLYVDNTYKSFINKVAIGRKLDINYVDSIAQGRVWSGEDALKAGLVDEIGGLNYAISKAAEIVKLKDYKIIMLPKQENVIEFIQKIIEEDNAKVILSKLPVQIKDMYNCLNAIVKNDTYQARLPFIITSNIY